LLDAFAAHEASRLAVYLPESASESAFARRVGLSYDLTELALEGVAAWCARHDVGLRVVAIPDVLAVDSSLLERALAGGDFTELEGFDPAALDLDRPGRSLAGWCAKLGAPFLDLRPALVERTRELKASDPMSEGLYLFGDSHWNAAGHRLAAERIEAWRAETPLD
jgi:hypothetical protein